MAIDIIIEAKGLLAKEELDFPAVLRNSRLKYGSYTAYFVLDTENTGDVGLLYNPSRMGRGIYIDLKEKDQGKVILSFNLPTTETEILDVFRVVGEVKKQYRNIQLTVDSKVMSFEDLVGEKEKYIQYSLSTLRGFCETRQYESAILTTAAFPYTLTPDEMVFFSEKGTLADFEELLHSKQLVEADYACPKIMRKDSTDELVAFYTLVEDNATIMPIECSCFLSLEHVPIAYGLVRFYIHSQERVIDGYLEYDNFVAVLLEHGAEYFDGDHLYIPPYSVDELQELAVEILAMPKNHS